MYLHTEIRKRAENVPSAPVLLAETSAATNPVGAKQMGAVIKATQARLQGKTVDGKALSEKVRARLSA